MHASQINNASSIFLTLTGTFLLQNRRVEVVVKAISTYEKCRPVVAGRHFNDGHSTQLTVSE
jgi:hypothetical protein